MKVSAKCQSLLQRSMSLTTINTFLLLKLVFCAFFSTLMNCKMLVTELQISWYNSTPKCHIKRLNFQRSSFSTSSAFYSCRKPPINIVLLHAALEIKTVTNENTAAKYLECGRPFCSGYGTRFVFETTEISELYNFIVAADIYLQLIQDVAVLGLNASVYVK